MAEDMQEVRIHTEVSGSDKTRQMQGDQRLDDDKNQRDPGFNGATLHIDSVAENGNDRGVTFAGSAQVRTVSSNPPNTQRYNPSQEPDRSSMTTVNVGSKTAVDDAKSVSDFSIEKFFSLKPGAFENAVQSIKTETVTYDLDGSVTGAWLLTQIDHWDNEKEVVVVLTDNSLILTRYDFVTGVIKENKRIFLHIVDAIQIGDLVYPEKSLMMPRNFGGVRAFWNKGSEPSFGQKWNPFCTDIPYITLAHHPALYNEKLRNVITYNVDNFFESFVQAVKHSYQLKNPGRECVVQECKIEMTSYLGVSSVVHNQSLIGFSRERGGVSF